MKSSRLPRNPAKVREWEERSRERARERARTAPPRTRKRKVKIPAHTRRRALSRSEGLCVRPGCGRRATQLHHALPESKYPELALARDNLLGVCSDCHERHESAYLRLPWEALPPCTLVLASHDLRHWAYLKRTYPRAPHCRANGRPGPAGGRSGVPLPQPSTGGFGGP